MREKSFRPRDEAAEIAKLIGEIKETADKLVRDGVDRGDAKLLARSLKELRYSFKLLAKYRQRPKVTIFGSARTPPDAAAFRQARAFGKAMAEEGWMVVTGAGPGIMEAGHEGAGAENSIGINILLPFEQDANPVIAADEKLIHLRYFFTRKLVFLKESDGVALFPGGFGTLDEGFEVLTLLQTGKAAMIPVVLVDEPGGRYWAHWLEYVEEQLLRGGLISPEDLHLFRITDSVDVAKQEFLDFYRVYHSMRYVLGWLVFRLREPIPEAKLAEIRRDFKDILRGGDFELAEAHAHEANEPHVADLPRLAFKFDRRSYGRLRQLIDVLNRRD